MQKKILKYVLILQGGLWVYFAVQFTVAHFEAHVIYNVISALMILDAIAFITIAFLYDKARWLKFITALFLAGNLVLTVTDQMGLADYIVLVLNIISIILLVWVFIQQSKRIRKQSDIDS